jgi:hypothetical protein
MPAVEKQEGRQMERDILRRAGHVLPGDEVKNAAWDFVSDHAEAFGVERMRAMRQARLEISALSQWAREGPATHRVFPSGRGSER